MGGFGKAIGTIAFEQGEKLAEKAIQNPAVHDGLIHFVDGFFGHETTFTGKSGEWITKQLKTKFEPEFDRQLSIQTKAAQAGGGITPPHEIHAAARNAARQITFGKNDQLLAGAIKAAEQEHGQNKAQTMVDRLGIYFHEKAFPTSRGQTSSQLVGNLGRNKATANLPFTPSPYKPPQDLERGVMKVTTAALAYKAGLAHLSTPLNMLITQNISSFGKAMGVLFGHDYAGTKAALIASDSIGHALAEEYQQAYQFRNGMIAKYAPGSIGEMLSKNWMVPGLSAIRQRSMIAAAYQGGIVAKEAAHELINGNAKHGAVDLQWLGIDPNEILASGGVLSPEHIRQAQYMNVQKTIFANSGLTRARYATAGPFGRMVTVFHNYAAMQGNMIASALKKDIWEKRDPVAAFKTIATLAIVAPNVGNFTYTLEQLARGKEWDDPTGHFLDREKALYGANAFKENIESFSHIAGFGVATSYARAAGKEKLATAMLGAVPNAAIEIGQDIAKASPSGVPFVGQKHPSAIPLARDILHDIPSLGIGSILADKLFPTKAEQLANRPKTIKQIKRAQHRRKNGTS
jgi:hypothetical protein